MNRLPVLLALLSLIACVDAERVEQRAIFEFCDDAPCGWTLEAGKAEPGPTWHRRATGLSLVTQGTRIQRTFVGLRCLNLHYRADFQAAVRLSIDTNGGGAPEFTEPMHGRAFSDVQLSYRIAPGTEEMTVAIEKVGAGRAVLSAFDWQGSFADVCANAVELPATAPSGGSCDAGTDCRDAP